MPVNPRIRAVAATAAIATAMTLGVAGVAFASDNGPDPVPCKDLPGKGAVLGVAADILNLVDVDITLLGEREGIVCGPPVKRDDDPDDPSCDDFDSQADAQEALDDDEDLAEFLDRDDDGVACESLFDDDDASNDDDDDSDDSGDDKKESKDDDSDDDGESGGQVKVYPKGGVDTGGFEV